MCSSNGSKLACVIRILSHLSSYSNCHGVNLVYHLTYSSGWIKVLLGMELVLFSCVGISKFCDIQTTLVFEMEASLSHGLLKGF